MDEDNRYIMLPVSRETGMPIIGFMYLSMVREDQIIEFKGQFDTQNFVYMPFPVTDHTNDVMSDY